MRAAVVVPVAVLALVAVALATAYWWRRKGRESPPGSAKAGDVEASMSSKPGERYGSGMGPFPGALTLYWRLMYGRAFCYVSLGHLLSWVGQGFVWQIRVRCFVHRRQLEEEHQPVKKGVCLWQLGSVANLGLAGIVWQMRAKWAAHRMQLS